MINTILCFGDSFTYGEELDDKQNAWPFVLGKKLNAEVKNYAVCGGSNDQIIRKLIRCIAANEIPCDNTEKLSGYLVIIAWSILGRTEFHDKDGFFDTWPARSGRMWMDEQFQHRQQLTKYVSLYHHESSFNEKYLQQILIAQTLCKSLGIKYLMLDILQNDYYKSQVDFLFDPDSSHNRVYSKYSDYESKIDKNYFIDYGNKGMLEWVPDNVPRGPAKHFLDEGHLIVADHIHENIMNSGWGL